MSFKLSQLLNPAPSPQHPSQPSTATQQPSPPSQALPPPDQVAPPSSWQRHRSFSTGSATAVTPAHEATAVLTTLATSAAPAQHHSYAYSTSPLSSSRDRFSPVHNFPDARLQSAYGAVAAAPIEPSPPVEPIPILHSPTLDHYHHGSRSPDEHRRPSIVSRPSPPPRLAPIQTLTSAFGDQSGDQPQRASAFGHDNSYILPPPRHSALSTTVARSDSDDYRRGVERENRPDELALSHSHKPAISLGDPHLHHHLLPHNSTSPTHAKRPANLPSPPLQIKSEVSLSGSRDATPNRPSLQPTQPTPPTEGIDAETLKAIKAMTNEHGLRGSKPKQKVEPMGPDPDGAAATKKRPAPKTTAATKKGIAKKAPPTKKRKVDADAASGGSPTGAIRPSPTPSKTSKTATKPGKLSKSSTPALGSSPPAGEPLDDELEDDAASVESNDDVFCVCRKGDNHTWMIACDGGCEDWFHGRCVKMREEDGDLIDKYICPSCEAKGGGVTTWKPMCRFEGCRKPARVSKSNASKYCSDECGLKFMRYMVSKSNSDDLERKKKARHRRKYSRTDNLENSVDGIALESDDEDMGPKGGPLRTREIKALATGVTDVDSFRRLGDGVLTPPYTSSPTATGFPNGDAKPNGDMDDDSEKNPLSYTLQPSERDRIQAIAEEKDAMRAHKALLKDRATFVTMAKDQVIRYAERENIKPKDVCGFDSRLSWSDREFGRWRDGKVGRTALQLQTLEPADVENGADDEPAAATADGEEKPQVNGEVESKQEDADAMDVDAEPGDDKKDANPPAPNTFCARKRCERHKQWQKVTLQTLRFDEMDLGDKMRALEREEREIRERAMLRWRREVGGKGDENSVELLA